MSLPSSYYTSVLVRDALVPLYGVMPSILPISPSLFPPPASAIYCDDQHGRMCTNAGGGEEVRGVGRDLK